MLVIDDNSVYEIDEDCIKKKKIPKECGVCDKILKDLQKDDKNEEHKKQRTKRS